MWGPRIVTPDDLFEAQKLVDQAVADRVRASGANNFSRVVGELEKAGYIARYYEGYRTPHANKGGCRNLVCVLESRRVGRPAPAGSPDLSA